VAGSDRRVPTRIRRPNTRGACGCSGRDLAWPGHEARVRALRPCRDLRRRVDLDASLASPRDGHGPLHGLDRRRGRHERARRTGERRALAVGLAGPVDGTAQSRVTDLSYTVHIAGGGVQVGTVTIAQDGLSWSGTVDLESISNATVGLFEVTAEVQTTGRDCSGVAYACIEGRSPSRRPPGPARRRSGSEGGSCSCCRSRGLVGSARPGLRCRGSPGARLQAWAPRSFCSSSARSHSRRRAPRGSRWSSGRSALSALSARP
jgi:hypothetical protein